MVFNTIEFAFFFAIVFLSYWLIFNKNLRAQNFFILAASYFFYGWWDWHFLSLIFISSLVDFSVGQLLHKQTKTSKRKILLVCSLIFNLGLLGFFKYYNFFIESFNAAFHTLGLYTNLSTLNIILPIGISFYTFQTISYTIDVYSKNVEPTKDPVAFFAYVAFFPQLVAGPIEKARSLLPQFKQKRIFNYSQAVDGMRQALWGLFKKLVIADNCANHISEIFMYHESMPSSMLLIGAGLFAIQVYTDFSGYSDMAIGLARVLGFKLSRNFNYPFFSSNIVQLWQRWHITLMDWFREYLYIPLGGNRKGNLRKLLNVFIVFTLSGLWHGPKITLVGWGMINGMYVILAMLISPKTYKHNTILEGEGGITFYSLIQMLFTFSIFSLSTVFFRAANFGHATEYFKGILFNDFYNQLFDPKVFVILATIIIMFLIEWYGRKNEYPLAFDRTKTPKVVRWTAYYCVAFAIYFFKGYQPSFFYFQF